MKQIFSGCPRAWIAGIVFVFLAGCSTSNFSPPRYAVDPNRPSRPATARTITVCPAFDRLDDNNRDHLDSRFSPSAYLSDAIEQELTADGIKHERAAFAYAPSFAGIQKALAGGAQSGSSGVVLAAAMNHFQDSSPALPDNRTVSCDFKLYSSTGNLLFEKRCLCMIAGYFSMEAPQMVMQQLFADPDFQKAIQ